jgi:NADH-quinone oxidoreductase subunit L
MLGVLSSWWDKWIIDGLVNVVAFIARILSWPARIVQTGMVQNYAWFITAGVLIFVLYSVLR